MGTKPQAESRSPQAAVSNLKPRLVNLVTITRLQGAGTHQALEEAGGPRAPQPPHPKNL